MLNKIEMGSNAYSSFENNTTIYFTQCLVFAQTNDCQFQKQISENLIIK